MPNKYRQIFITQNCTAQIYLPHTYQWEKMFKFEFCGCSLNYIFSILASRLRFCPWPSHPRSV